jgi:hypothetical protein
MRKHPNMQRATSAAACAAGRPPCGRGRGRAVSLAALALLLGVAVGCGPGPAPPGFSDGPHAGDVVVGSDEKRGGNLAAEVDFSQAVELTLTATLGGYDLYTASEPGFDVLALDEPGESFYVLADGIDVSFEIVSVDPGAAVKFGNAILDEPGDAALLGEVPELHVHPEWQVAVPAGSDPVELSIVFRLVSESGTYGPSPEYTLILSTGHAE